MRPDNKFVDLVVEQANWKGAGISGMQKTEPKKEDKPIVEDKKPEKKDEKPVNEGKKEDKTEKHVCPLCESELKEPLSDKKMLEHAGEMYAVFEAVEKSLNEESEDSEDDEDSEDETDEDEDVEDSEEDK